MIRRLFNTTSVLSLLLCLAVVLLWLISFWASVGVQAKWTTAVPDPYGELPLECTLRLGVDRGSMAFVSWRDHLGNWLDPKTGRLEPVSREPVAFSWTCERGKADTIWESIAGRWVKEHDYAWFSNHVLEIRFLAAPLWAVTVLLGLLPAASVIRQRGHRTPPGHCPTCGYDLRASKQRCPECGTPINSNVGTTA